MITAKINASKIEKQHLYEGKAGKYLDIALFENKDGTDKYGNDGFVVQSVSREARERGERGPIIGNWRDHSKRTESRPPAAAAASAAVPPVVPPPTECSEDLLPF